MFHYIWPIVLVILSNVMYQLCARRMPNSVDPFAALTVTYLVGAAASLLLYLLLHKGGNIIEEFSQINWVPFIFGLVIVGIEVGWIFVYRAGWQVSTAPIVQSAIVAVILIILGFFLFKESMTWNKILGIAVCILGLFFINLKP
ncbi:MAG TPA: EamA family transporter [Methanocorpusculum sp.]|nr:EamA family transporter [Methanocorpusculum sp.]HJJ85091.1 EamA family transporter [Methanocorpusculum sp.]